MGASFRNVGQIAALAGCDLLTISPELLAELAASEAPLTHALDAEAAQAPRHPESRRSTRPAFRFALNEDAMATEKLAEGIRAFAADAVKLEKLMEACMSAHSAAIARPPGRSSRRTTTQTASASTCARPLPPTRPLRHPEPVSAASSSPTCRRT